MARATGGERAAQASGTSVHPECEHLLRPAADTTLTPSRAHHHRTNRSSDRARRVGGPRAALGRDQLQSKPGSAYRSLWCRSARIAVSRSLPTHSKHRKK